MEKINVEKIRTKYQEIACSNEGIFANYRLERVGDDTEISLKILANKINEIIDILNDREFKTTAKWVPKIDEEYFYIDSSGSVIESTWKGNIIDKYRLKTNNIFKTERKAEKAYLEIMS